MVTVRVRAVMVTVRVRVRVRVRVTVRVRVSALFVADVHDAFALTQYIPHTYVTYIHIYTSTYIYTYICMF